jgi:hypothetical protein
MKKKILTHYIIIYLFFYLNTLYIFLKYWQQCFDVYHFPNQKDHVENMIKRSQIIATKSLLVATN